MPSRQQHVQRPWGWGMWPTGWRLSGPAQRGCGALPEGTDLLFLFFFFFLGKTCFPACWRPVENWSAAAWGVKDLEAVLCEVLKPKQTLFMKPWHICVCRTSAQNVTARESRLPPLGCPFTLSFLLSPQASFCFAKGRRVEICWFKNDNLKSAVDKSKRDQKLSRT